MCNLILRQIRWTISAKKVSRDSCRYSYSLRARRSGDRILLGARFSARVQTVPEAETASCTMGTGSLPGVKRPGRGVDHPTPSSAELEDSIELGGLEL